MDDNKAPIQCSICQETFATNYSLIRHTGRKHKLCNLNNRATDTNSSATDTNCTAINRNHIIQKEPNTLAEEIDTITPNCPLCHKDFSRNRYLRKHIEKCKGVINRLQCEYCEKEFKHENSRCRHYKTCATKKDMAAKQKEAEEDKVKTVINNSGQTNNQLGTGTQNINNNTNNNIIIVYNPSDTTPFTTDHLKAIDFKKILKLANNKLDSRALKEFSKQVFENEANRCIRKTNIKLGHSTIHVGENKWELKLDKHIYPKLAVDMANNMSEYVDEKRETFKRDMYIRLRDFVYDMCDAGYINADPTDREKELRREFKTFTEGLKLIVYGNTAEL